MEYEAEIAAWEQEYTLLHNKHEEAQRAIAAKSAAVEAYAKVISATRAELDQVRRMCLSSAKSHPAADVDVTNAVSVVAAPSTAELLKQIEEYRRVVDDLDDECCCRNLQINLAERKLEIRMERIENLKQFGGKDGKRKQRASHPTQHGQAWKTSYS